MAKNYCQVKNYERASARDRSGNPFCHLSQSNMGKKIEADSPVPLRLAWQAANILKGIIFFIDGYYLD
jgi:hypothetical protein